MTEIERFVKGINAYVSQYGNENVLDVDEVLAAGGVSDKKGSILPTDYCYNRYNNGLGDFNGPHLFEYTEDGRFLVLGEGYPYTGNIFHKPKGQPERIVGSWDSGQLRLDAGNEAILEIIKDRRDYLVEWLKPELKSIPVSIYGEAENVFVRFQELLICGIEVQEEVYRVFNASDEWKDNTTYHCEQEGNGTWFYYVESADETIAECKRLVMFEATKNRKKTSTDGENEPLVSDYWIRRTRDIIKDIMNKGESKNQKGIVKHMFQCYGERPRDRMQIWLNPSNSRSPELFTVWIGEDILKPNRIPTDVGDVKVFDRDGFQETHIKFPISSGINKLNDIEAAFDFVRRIRNTVEG